MNNSFGDNKKRLGGSSSSLTEVRRRAVVGQTWNFTSKQPKVPSASYITTIEAMNASTLAFENARNSGVVPRITLTVDVPSTTMTATVVATTFIPVRILNTVAIADTPVFSVSPALPFGLTFSAADGSVSGTPMETISATAFTVTVTATSIYQTVVTTTSSFSLTVGDSTSTGLSYRGYTGTPLSSSLPSIVNAESTWGTRNDSIIAGILSSTVNQIFDAEDIPAEQAIAAYFSGYFKAPESGTYTFGYSADDGIQMIIGGTTIINGPGSSTTHSGTSTPTITLVANRYYTLAGLWSQGGGPGNLVFNALTIGGTNKLATYPIKTRFYN